MNEISPFSDFDPLQLSGLATAIALVLGLIFFWIYKYRHPSVEKQVEKTVKENSQEYVKDIVLSDGLYGYHFIDYLILLPGKIIVLGLQSYDGYIFGADKIEQWAQVLNNRSYNFDNPLLKTSHYVQSVQELVGSAQVTGRVVFSGNCSFPKGIPDGVIEVKGLSGTLNSMNQENADQQALKPVWDQLLETCKQQKSKYLKENS